MHRLINVILFVIALALALSGDAASAQVGDGFDLGWNVMGGAGGPLVGDGHSLRGTLGQTAIGSFSDASHQVANGYWAAGEREYRIYLPLVLRNLE